MYCSVVIATSKRRKFRALPNAPRLSTSMALATVDLLPADSNYERLISYIFCLVLLVIIIFVIYLFVFVNYK